MPAESVLFLKQDKLAFVLWRWSFSLY